MSVDAFQNFPIGKCWKTVFRRSPTHALTLPPPPSALRKRSKWQRFVWRHSLIGNTLEKLRRLNQIHLGWWKKGFLRQEWRDSTKKCKLRKFANTLFVLVPMAKSGFRNIQYGANTKGFYGPTSFPIPTGEFRGCRECHSGIWSVSFPSGVWGKSPASPLQKIEIYCWAQILNILVNLQTKWQPFDNHLNPHWSKFS